jgi:hypothetical protein
MIGADNAAGAVGRLLAREDGAEGQQAEADCRRLVRLHAERVGDRLAEDLEAAADADRRRAAARQGDDRAVQPALAQGGEVGDRALRAGRIRRSGVPSCAASPTKRTRTPGSFASGSKSSKLLICGRRITAMSRTVGPLAASAFGRRSSATESSSGSPSRGRWG